jgi:Domain of unknown function (DUF4118)
MPVSLNSADHASPPDRIGRRPGIGMWTMASVRHRLRAHRGVIALLLAIGLPLGVSALLTPFRATFADSAASLVLAAAVTLVATVGSRATGYVAAVSASLWFDFFLTRPYDRVQITHRPDIEITVSLLLVGIIITELADRIRRHHRRADEEASYVDLLYRISEQVAAGEPFDEVARQVRLALIDLLHLRDCRVERGTGGVASHEIRRDGGVRLGPLEWPVRTWGLPGRELHLPLLDRGSVVGRIVLLPTAGEPVSLQRRLVAVALADQLGNLAAPRRRSA